MAKKFLIFGILVTLFAVFTIRTNANSSLTGHKIVIDPGHGGSDRGSMECPGLYESVANLDIANRLKALLENDGATVYMTRTDDSFKTNEDRYNGANNFGGQALVSIHLNGSTNHNKNGTLGLYGKRNKDMNFTKTVYTRLKTELRVPDLGVTNFASGVLLKSNMPATMQEAVYISNTTECNLLKDPQGERQQQIAESLYNGLVDWFRSK